MTYRRFPTHRRPPRWLAAVFLIGLALALVGCGGGGGQSQGQAQGAPPQPVPAPTPIVVGRIYLGGEVANATLRLEDLRGQVFASGVSQPDGLVFFQNVVAPPDFRAVATLPGFSREFRAEMRGFDQTSRQVRVTPLTDLASRYLEANPGVPLAEAERRVKQPVQVPDAVSVSIGLDEPNPVFSDLALLRAAGQNGGWVAYSAVILGQAANGGGRPYLLSLDQLDRPITGLESALLVVAQASRIRLQQRLGIPDATPARLAQRFPHPYNAIQGPTSLVGQFLLGVGTGLATDLIETGLKAVLGWAANQMGLNFGESAQLQQIQDELNRLTTLVGGLVNTIDELNLTNEIKYATGLLTSTRTANDSMLSALVDPKLTTITNQPFSQPPSFANVVAAINAPDYPTVLSQVNNAMIGPTKIILWGAKVALTDQTGIDRPAAMQGFPWRSNTILDRVNTLYQSFAGQQILALNLYAEQLHNYLVNPDLAFGLSQLEPNFRATVANLKIQRQQLPLYQSQDTLVDYQNGVMWYYSTFHKTSWSSANATAGTWTSQVVLPDGSVQVYGHWRLPTYGEFISLQNRAMHSRYDPTVPVASHNSYPDIGQSTAGLPALGFNVAALNTTGGDGKKGYLWFNYYRYEDDQYLDFYKGYAFLLNDKILFKADSDETYLLCRGFGPDTLVPIASVGDYHPKPGEFGNDFTAPEYAQYGLPTQITLSTTAAPANISYPDPQDNTKTDTFNVPAGSLQAVANVTYQINTGGSFTVGNATSSKSYSNAAHSYTGTVSTADRGTGHPNVLRELVNWSSSDNSALRMLNLPYVGGIATPLKTSPATLTASLLGEGGVTVSGSVNVTPTTVIAHTLTSIRISPRNQIYGASGSTQPATGSFPYYCTGYYSDGTVEALGPKVAWSISPNTANAQFVTYPGGVSLLMNEPPQATPVAYNVTITASYQGMADNITNQIVPP